MNVSDLVTEFNDLGVRLWAHDGRLRFRAPHGVLTDERRAVLTEHKAELLRHLDRGVSGADLVTDPAAGTEPFPLTPVQSAYLLGRGTAYDYGGVACVSYLEVSYPGVAPDRLESAWHTLVGRHDMLRAVVHPDGYQQVLAEVEPYRIPVTDLRSAADEVVTAELDARRDELTRRAADTARWPLFALRITRTDDTTILHLAIELIVVDAASLQSLLTELDDLLTGAGPTAGTEVTFRDYVLAEQRLRTGGRYQADRDYWLGKLDDLPPAPALPVTPPQDATADVRFERRHRWLTDEQLAGLRRAAGTRGVTVSGVLLAAYAEVIGRWSRHRRFTLNLPLFNRLPLHADINAVVGDFTSVSLLAVDLDERATFAERVDALSARLFDDLDHRLFSGLDVLGELSRRAGAPVLMPVVFTSTVGLAAEVASRSTAGTIRRGLTQTPQVWIDCQVTEHAGQVMLAWDVRDGVLPDGVADAAFAAYVELVEQLAADGAVWDSRTPIPLPAEHRDRRERANATEIERVPRLLHTPVFEQAAVHPDAPAVIAGDTVLSFGDLAARARAVADRLRAAGCEPGERVAVLMDKGPEQVVAVLAVLLAGGVYLPVDPQPAARRDKILAGAGVRLALVQSWLTDLPGSVSTVAVDEVPGAGVVDLAELGGDPAAPAYVIYTSGSTGEPKGVVISHQAAANTVDDINGRFAITRDDRVCAVAQLGFDLSVWDIFGVLGAGGCLVMPAHDRRGDPSHWAELVAGHGVTVWNSVPAQLQMVLDYLDSTGRALPSLRLAMLSGDWIPLDLPDRVRVGHPGLRVVSLGGATEAAIWSVWHPIGTVEPDWRSIPYGTPLENQTCHVLDDADQDCPEHVPGELYLGGIGLADGYLNDAERTAQRFVTHPRTGARLYRTGDIARYLPHGTLEFLGREDNQVKVRGHRIELGEIEAALRTHPAVADGAVILDGHREHARLAAFAEPARTAERDTGAGEVFDAARTVAARIDAELDRESFVALMRAVDEVAVLAIARQLRAAGLFATDDARHDLHEIATATGVARSQQGLLRRWLSALVDADALTADPALDGYSGLIGATDDDIERAWKRIDSLNDKVGYGAATLDYIRTCSGRLDELLDGRLDVRELLFPDGRIGAASAVYRDNLVGRSVHRIVIAAIRAVAAQRQPHTLRVLEVGGGIAGTSAELIPALAEFEPDYHFTDISEFFLSEAKDRFADYPWVRYGRFDINDDARPQGMAANSADVILCANVLHNSRNAGEVLARLREILAPGGWLVFLEPTKRHNYPLLVSMEFEFFSELTRFTDLRQGTDQAFFTRDQWLGLLAEADADQALCLPDLDDAVASSGQGVFLAQFTTDRALVTPDELTTHLRALLPGYQVPSHLELVDALPRSANGKLDRAALTALVPARDAAQATEVTPPADDLERRIAELWAEMLPVEVIGRDQDFYTLGGDSLLLSRMVGKLREREPEAAGLQWQELLRHLLTDATVRGLARYLRDTTRGERRRSAAGSTIVALNDAADREAATWVLVHGGTGTVQHYQPLLPHLRQAHRGRLVGVQLADVDRYLDLPPEIVIDRLAAGYAAELLRSGDRFHLTGYCVGGLLATEIARTLTEAGAAVDLTVISSYRPPAVDDELMVSYVFALSMGADLASAGMPADSAAFSRAVRAILDETPDRIPDGALAGLDGEHAELGARFRALASTAPEERLRALHRAGNAAGGYNSGSYSFDEFSRFYDFFRHTMHAVSRHQPDPYLGDLTLLRNSESSTLLPGTRADVGGFWREICVGELRVHDIPGDHFSCIAAANAPALAARLLSGMTGTGGAA